MDKTADAVRRQLAAMSCRRFRLGIFDAKAGTMEPSVVDADGVLAMLPRLKARNHAGADIYIQPDPTSPHALVFVDDIDLVTVDDMSTGGFPPRVFVETSFKNGQAWLVFERPLEPFERGAIARMLAVKYGADRMSAASDHFGRLAGFTNRKPKHLVDGVAPFVLLRRARPSLPPLAVPKDITSLPAALPGTQTGKGAGGTFEDASRLVSRFHARLAARHGATFDASRADFASARVLVELGFDDAVIERALVAASPGLAERHPGTAEYVARTIRAARR